MSASKTTASYWRKKGRLFHDRGNPEWCVRFKLKGRRRFFKLGTPNLEAAASRAAKIYAEAVANGLEMVEEKHRIRLPEPAKEGLTVGEYLRAVEEIAVVGKLTLTSYKQALRRLAAEAALQLPYKGSKRAEWLEAVDGLPLSELTDNAVAIWQRARKDQCAGNPLAEKAAEITANTCLRSAKALFSQKRIISKLSDEVRALLPSPLPLSGTSLLPEDTSARFIPPVDPERLLALAAEELGAPRQPDELEPAFALREQMWIGFLLTFCAGLRRKEADLLIWPQVRLEDRDGPKLELALTAYFAPKNRAHAKPVPLDPEVAAILRGYKARHLREEFVLLGEKPRVRFHTGARCMATWNALAEWLRAHGVNDSKPIHALRKSIGAFMARKFGLHDAQRLLRHTTPAITSRYYSDAEAKQAPGIGGMLAGNVQSVDFNAEQVPAKRRAAK